MELAKLILDYVKVLTWPVTVIVFLCLFRKNLQALMGRIRKFDAFGVQAELAEKLTHEATPKEWLPQNLAVSEEAEPKQEENAKMDAPNISKIDLAVSSGAYSNDYRAILLVIGIVNRGDKPDQVISWRLYFASLNVELEPTPAPPNLIPGVPWWSSPLVKIPPNEFIQGSLFFRGRKALEQDLPYEPLGGQLTVKTLHGEELSHDVKVFRLSTLQD